MVELIERLAEPLQYGLLADHILGMLHNGMRRGLRTEDRKLLSRYATLMRLAEDGATQVQTRILRENAVEAISAHRMMMFSLRNFGFGGDTLLQNCLIEVEHTLQSNMISSTSLEKSRELARAIRKSCSYVIGKELGPH